MPLLNRITFDPDLCGGRPCIRGYRIRVQDVLELLADNMTSSEIVEQLPDLEIEDVQACLEFAAQRIGHPHLIGA